MKKHTDVKERIANHHRQVRSILFRQRMQLIRVLYGGKSYASFG